MVDIIFINYMQFKIETRAAYVKPVGFKPNSPLILKF